MMLQTPSQEAAALSPLPVSFQTLVTTKDRSYITNVLYNG